MIKRIEHSKKRKTNWFKSRLYTRSDGVFLVFSFIVLLAVLLIIAYPLYYVILGSFDPRLQARSGIPLLPAQVTFEGYIAAMQDRSLWRGYMNSIVYTTVGTLINLFVTICAAYPLSRKDFVGRKIFMTLFVFTMYFSGGLIPSYLLVVNLGMMDTMWALVLPGAIAVINIIIMRTYFQSSIPHEMLEAAQMDGCSNIRFLIKIVLPLSQPIIAVMVLFFSVGHWNSFFSALLYIRSADMLPLQMVLRRILILNQFDPEAMMNMSPEAVALLMQRSDVMRYVVIILASVPVMILYPLVQRYFVKGVMIGSIKE